MGAKPLSDDPRNALATAALPVAYGIALKMTSNQTHRLELAKQAAEEAVIWCMSQNGTREVIALVRSTVPVFITRAILDADKAAPEIETEPFPETGFNEPAAPTLDQDFLLDIADMPDKLRQPAELVCVEGRSMSEAAAILGIDRETVKRRLRLVYKKMQ